LLFVLAGILYGDSMQSNAMAVCFMVLLNLNRFLRRKTAQSRLCSSQRRLYFTFL